MKTCLVVDDSSVIRKVARRILEGLDFQIIEAEDGEQALGACQRQLPDGILLDWNMPKMDGYEVILGSSIDPQFGPVILFGMGGQLVEVFKDRALGLPPLNTTLARRMMERTKIFTALKGVRGRRPVDIAALEQLMVRFSRLVVEQPWIREIDINPLLASPDRLLALDARVVLHDPSLREEDLPRPAIRPYPLEYAGEWTMRNGETVLIRPIRPEDEPAMVRFHATLSEETVYARYFAHLGLTERIAHERLVRICFNDDDREIALVAERRDPATGGSEIVAVGRLSKAHALPAAEFAILVADRWQRRGIGTELLRRLVEIARAEGLERVCAEMLADNIGMRRIAERVGFRIEERPGDGTLHAELQL